MLSLNNNARAAVCCELTLPNLQQMSLTCQTFNQLINHPSALSTKIKMSALSKTDMKVLKLNFVLSHQTLFSIKQLTELDFSRLTLKTLCGIEETEASINILRKLRCIASLYLFKDVVDDYTKNFRWLSDQDMDQDMVVLKAQLPYMYLIQLFGREIEGASLEAEKINSEFKAAFINPLKLDDLSYLYSKIEHNVNRTAINQSRSLAATRVAFHYTILKIHNRPDLISILSTFWKKHEICHFAHQAEGRQYVPSEVFDSLCSVLSTQKQPLGDWSYWVLADEQV